MTRGEAVNWIINITADIGKAEHRELWHYEQALSEIREMLESEPERKRGEWIPEFEGKFTGGAYWFSCSKCKRIVPEVRNGGWNFCPNCGARMENE